MGDFKQFLRVIMAIHDFGFKRHLENHNPGIKCDSTVK
jgi:hypothetical protein